MTQSCRDCPSFCDQDEARRIFTRNRDIGAPACKRHGFILGKPGLSESGESRVCEDFARNCPDFGDSAPYQKAKVLASVCTPDVEAVVNRPTSPDSHLGSCRNCKNFVPETVVREELGWYLPLCAATGRLLTPAQQSSNPRDCEYASAGAPRTDTGTWASLDPRYSEGFSFANVGGSSKVYEVDLDTPFIEPTEYPTDRPVEERHAAIGIKSWRKVQSPKGDLHVFAPIFDPNFFTEAERLKIPKTGDPDTHPEGYIDHAGLVNAVFCEWLALDETPCLVGEAGTGKTEFFRHMAWLMQLPFERISFTKATEIDDVAGKWLFVDGETQWHDGRLTSGWGKPCVIVGDEYNTAMDEVAQFIRPMIDNSKQLVLDSERGLVRKRHDWCFLGLAINPPWDPKYTGIAELSDADSNRISSIYLDLPPENVERRILAEACKRDGWEISVDDLNVIMKIATDLRALVAAGSLTISWGIRPQIAVARKSHWYSLADSYRRAVVDRLEPRTGEMVMNIVSDYVV